MPKGKKIETKASGARRSVRGHSPLDELLPWYQKHKRPLPWREKSNPYSTWVSEIMLQQTSVSTVVPYFERWMTRFPTVHALAEAGEQDVLSLWQGLGYYRRCRNLLLGARRIAADGWPADAAGWEKMPGVGRYTAGAIASIALNEPTPVVDGNVERVYARLNADPATGGDLKRRAWAWAQVEMRAEHPGNWNQALMELGARICTPVNPRCGECPVASGCAAARAGLVGKFPTVTPKREVVRLEFDVVVPICDGRFGLRQIPAGEWWEEMWEFPRSPRGSLESPGQKLSPIKHTVTHHRITLFPTLVNYDDPDSTLRWFPREELHRLPLPAPQRKLATRAMGVIDECDAIH